MVKKEYINGKRSRKGLDIRSIGQFKINMIEYSREYGQHILKATQKELQQR